MRLYRSQRRRRCPVQRHDLAQILSRLREYRSRNHLRRRRSPHPDLAR